jgi:signal transduction histidine kinase/CheY-like chemotaxis protein
MDPLIRILHLEDDPADVELVQAKLEDAGLACRITCVQTRDEFGEALRQDENDIILADYRLPMYDGMSALRLTQELCPDVPFIFVSGTMGEDAAIEGLIEGATDYVLKQNLLRLGSAIKRALNEAENRRERKRAQRALQESEAKMRSILENIGIGVALIGPKMEILELNRRMREWHPAIDPAQRPICYRAFNDPPGEEVCDYCPTCKTLLDGLVHEATTQMPQAGVIRDYRIVSSPLLNKAGEVTAAIMMVEDITEKIILESQLRQAQKMESVGRLAGGVAHDFNNMLGVIIGHLELALIDLDPTRPLFADLKEIWKTALRSADLTRQLLGFARKQTVVPLVLDLNETVEGMLKMLRSVIGENIALVWLPRSGVWPVKMDPSQIDQILANLCVNARDAIAGVGKITIETNMVTFDEPHCAGHPGFIPGDFVMLTVSDDGQGMDKDTLDKIFEPFFTTKEMGKSTGLGLATIYGIVKQNNGFIDVSSKPDQGTTFNIYLPRHAAKTEQTKKESPAVPVERGDETILLVEDEPAMLKTGGLMLERYGYQVLAASTPSEAIRVAKKHAGEIHLIITDVVMPEMNGRDLAKDLLSLYPGLKHLFMSGYLGNVIGQQGALDQGENFIQKPFSMQALVAKVREVLDSKSGREDFVRKAFREEGIFGVMENHLGVRYVFDETTEQGAESRENYLEEILTPEALAEFPEDFLATLKQAVIDLDLDRIQTVIDQIRKLNASVAQALTDLADNFQFDKLLALVQKREA